jgi:hypothetical protein
MGARASSTPGSSYRSPVPPPFTSRGPGTTGRSCGQRSATIGDPPTLAGAVDWWNSGLQSDAASGVTTMVAVDCYVRRAAINMVRIARARRQVGADQAVVVGQLLDQRVRQK